MQVLVSDANILIDMEVGGLLESMFRVPEMEFIVPDILFSEELEDQHGHLLALGLRPKELTEETLSSFEQLVERNQRPSRNDLFALALAVQERCALLTGDRALRESAEREQIEVHGTLWLVEKMVTLRIVPFAAARMAYDAMEEGNRRLPFQQARNNLAELERRMEPRQP